MGIAALVAFTALIGLAANLLIIPLILVAARRFRLFDRIDHRKTHAGEIPALGGIGIFLSFALAGAGALLLLHLDLRGVTSTWRTSSILAGVALMHAIGVVDDARDIRAGRKFLLQALAALLVVSGGTTIGALYFPVTGFSFSLGYFAVPLSIFWIVAISNAMNLIDGIDGFAGGVAFSAALALVIIALARGDAFTATVSAALAGAVLGFLLFNMPPARIFMGDGGSLFLGFTLAVLSIMGNGEGVPILVPTMLLIVPVLDTLTAIVRRLRRRLPIYAPDANHFHHRLRVLMGSPRRTLLAAYTLNALAALGAMGYVLIGGRAGLLVLALSAAVLLTVFIAVFRLLPASYRPPGSDTPADGIDHGNGPRVE